MTQEMPPIVCPICLQPIPPNLLACPACAKARHLSAGQPVPRMPPGRSSNACGPVKALSTRQATRCETAKNKSCRCRCGGLLHGIKRAPHPDPEFFEQLPEDDPHHVPPRAEKNRRRRIRRQMAKMPLQTRLWEELTQEKKP